MMQRLTLPNEVLLPEIGRLVAEGEKVTLRAKGVSMLPFIHGGRDSVLLTRPEQGLKVGDIVLAQVARDRYVLHRIYEIDGDRLTLMGDGNIRGCERCRKEHVMALAVRILREGKEVDCTTPSHLRKAALWKALLPVRRYLLALYRRLVMR